MRGGRRRPARVGSVVHVRYMDHVFFKDTDASMQEPRMMEAVGRLDFENENYIRLVFEQYKEDSTPESRTRSMGLIILKSCIIELREA